MHPMFAEPHNKEEWRRYIDAAPPEPPNMLSYNEYQEMSESDRWQFNNSRAAYHSALVLVRTPDVKRLHYELDRRLEVNRYQPAGARRGKVIDGPATMGKSTLIKWFAADYERKLRKFAPERFVTDEGREYVRDYIPIVYVSIGSEATPKDLSIAIANFLMVPFKSSATKTAITDQVVKAMRICGTELVIFDEFHHLDVTLKEGKVANDHLKHLANYTAATFVYLGSNLKTSALFLEGRARDRATQTAARNDLHTMSLYKINTQDQIEEWAKIIATLEDSLLLFKHEPYSLARRHWRYLHNRTGGSIASLSHLIRESASEAIRSGIEAITVPVMDQISIDQRGNEHAAEARKRRRKQAVSKTTVHQPVSSTTTSA
ncbi:TniB family NTP-binding protein [Nocardia sp. NPDC050175]|uniref:TniB family NTP-binding protein n=1 Tax=Nocardia sp. NPDC050175 TaxID=3364317 RepID=UPI0037B617F5